MPVEQRIISSQKIGGGGQKIGGGSSAPAGDEVEAPKKSKKKLFIIVGAVAVIAIGAGAYLMLGKSAAPAEGAVPEPEPTPTYEPGAVLPVDPISINLAEGHYLRLGLGLQLTTEVGEEKPDPSKALDLAIALFSGKTVAEIADPATRDALKAELATELAEAYEGEVMDVYLTNYVTQ